MPERPRAHTLYAAGSNSHGQLAPHHRDDLARWTRISLPPRLGPTAVKSIACGANHSIVVVTDPHGRTHLLGAGSDARGQLSARPDPRLRLALEPVDLDKLCDGLNLALPVASYEVEHVAASWETSFVVLRPRDPASRESDVLVSFGANDWGERGAPSAARDEPSVVALDETLLDVERARATIRIVDLVAGPRHALALVEVVDPPAPSDHAPAPSRRRLLGWGASRHGQLGVAHSSSPPPRTTPIPREVAVPAPLGASSIVSLSAGRDHSAVLFRRAADDNEKVLLLGSNKHGQLGAPLAGRDAAANSPARQHVINGAQFALSTAARAAPVVAAVHCTWSSTFLAFSPSSPSSPILAFGLNGHGQLGTPSSSSPDVDRLGVAPTFPPSSAVRVLAAGSEHVLALLDCPRDGREGLVERQVWGWGWNEHGNLGLAAGESEGQREGEGNEGGAVVPADVRSPRRVWPPHEHGRVEGDEQPQGRPVRVWAGMASSWILFEQDEDDAE
ncbi:uncharacterized protein RHOBADRAFT_50597 [Rhodotorula graminis WP1]|uniref:Uncharacterized protein n=1 Tax=Rhodotorula graminis (strain WP1) TaxID=578459 RepID=A0A194SBW7_RHOGW|nr:uncharacterized protein RHOBADRAFT_50597 [Rhodotorula graminis WP1]KPV78084.1 hypothetical protein RHOBADRAFT_50597 [Rhodotorula graminis WP1]